MANGSAIEWTEATWNPTTGCTKISQGCKNCYAATLSKRLKAMGIKKYKKEFEFVQHENELDLPLKWKKSRKIFVNSMSDLFHEKSEMEFVGKCFFTMIKADWHIYQVLTKRPNKMFEFSQLFEKYFGFQIPSHIWMGTSVENNNTTWRIDDLRKVRSSMKFISFEPLLEEIDPVDLTGIDWAIIGGESGYHYRPVQKEWIVSLIKQCKKQDVKVFFKQWGGVRPKSGGRTLNGRKYSAYPKSKPNSPVHLMKMEKIKQLDKITKIEQIPISIRKTQILVKN